MSFAVFGCAFGEEGLCHYLCDDSAYFTHGSAKAMACATVAGGKTFAGNDEGRGVRAEIEEELGHDVKCEEGTG